MNKLNEYKVIWFHSHGYGGNISFVEATSGEMAMEEIKQKNRAFYSDGDEIGYVKILDVQKM